MRYTDWARSDTPLVVMAVGREPIDNYGNIHKWNEIKAAFAAVSPTVEQGRLKEWARSAAGCVE